ncbi:hypothetical protein BaRGS_00004596, partial [Batillaria attramentaria]
MSPEPAWLPTDDDWQLKSVSHPFQVKHVTRYDRERLSLTETRRSDDRKPFSLLRR